MEAGEIPDCGHMSGHVAAGEGPTDSLRRFSHKSPSLGTCRKAYIRKSGPLATLLIQQSLGTTVTVHIHTFVGTQETVLINMCSAFYLQDPIGIVSRQEN